MSVIAVTLAAAVFLGGARFGFRTSGTDVLGVTANAAELQAKKHFLIDGDVTGLYPGVSKRLVVRVRNPFNSTLKVTQIHPTVLRVDSPGCPSTDLGLADFVGTLVVPAHGQATVSIPVSLSSDAANACQGAKWQLRYTGNGEKV